MPVDEEVDALLAHRVEDLRHGVPVPDDDLAARRRRQDGGGAATIAEAVSGER
jgi:hypothetical protein